MVSTRVWVLVSFVFLLAAAGAAAQVPYGIPESMVVPRPYQVTESLLRSGMTYHHAVGFKKFINSFTSYQFPNPFPPGQDPLSRLEFPIDQWFAGLKAGCDTPSWNFACEAWLNLNKESSLKMQDSDWDDPNYPSQKTIFSESDCRLNKGLLVDVSFGMANPLVSSFDLRPVVGYRYQLFDLTTHDGFQADIQGNTVDLPGDGITFRQIFEHYYLGVLFRMTPRRRGLFGLPRGTRISFQADYAIVTAKNEDLHLLRAGERITRENTRGHAWHLALSASLVLSEVFRARLEGSFNRIVTDGSHNLTNQWLGIDFSFDGSRVWSDQGSVSAYAELLF